jgi:hypothetical protein
MAVQVIRPIRLVHVQASNSVNINRNVKKPAKAGFFLPGYFHFSSTETAPDLCFINLNFSSSETASASEATTLSALFNLSFFSMPTLLSQDRYEYRIKHIGQSIRFQMFIN